MKKFATSLIVFAAFGIVFYIAMLMFVIRFVPASFSKNIISSARTGYTFERVSEAGKIKNVDVLILGSSHAYKGYDTRIFKKNGFKAFNLGTSAQSPIQTYYLLKKYLTTLNPKFVVIDIYPILFNNDGVESQIDLLSCGLVDKDAVNIAFELNNIKVYNSLAFSFLNKKLHIKKQEKVLNGEEGTYISGGYVESYKAKKLTSPDPEYTVHITPRQLNSIHKIVALLKTKHIKYVFVQAPLPPYNFNSCTNNKQTDRMVAGFGKYYNFNNTLALPDSMFFDHAHLNQYGAEVFNTILIDSLKKDHYLQAYTIR